MDELFVGSAVSTISARGELTLPEHFCITIQARQAREDLFIGLHADDPCMLVYDRRSVADQHCALSELGGEPSWDSGTRDTLLRRRLGFVAPAQMDGKGRLRIASWMRSRRGVRQRALLVGMGRHFEVWNLDQVLEQGPGDLIVLAALHLDSLTLASPTIKEDHHEPALSRLGARRRAARPGKSGVPVQPLPALPARPDPLRAIGGRVGGR
ncbi:hypothetical protein U1737_05325 [Sphingomonas sp. LB3N6]|uniref:hypothetical protein n=1 Tax=Sphingomonas fucosidasi TaxID=3096164 RepID=UPI002FC588BE